jgi:hypothetical protein
VAVDYTQTGTTALVAGRSGKAFVPIRLIVQITSKSGSPVQPTATVTTNGGAAIFASLPRTAGIALATPSIDQLSSGAWKLEANKSIDYIITVASTGGTLSGTVGLVGYWVTL